MTRFSAALTGATGSALESHLLRQDGQEDLCFLTWRPSTGRSRATSLVQAATLPKAGERDVHGNASFQPEYLLRAAQIAGKAGHGLGFVHSHPQGSGWQPLNKVDQLAETRIANVARELTGLPLLGLTLSGDRSWSARVWKGAGTNVVPIACESVRVIGDGLCVTYNSDLLPAPQPGCSQKRTVHTWGEETQATIARLRVAVAGVGSVGMVIAELLARTGIEHIGVFDFDTVEWVNLDRLRGAGVLDAYLKRPKVHIARRVMSEASTASNPQHEFHELSICEPDCLTQLLDYDLIFSCVDRPWPRHVLNTIAYADLIPVIEGGMIAIQNRDRSLRNAYWSSTTVRPGRPCLACLAQYDPGLVQAERDGSLDDPSYIANLPRDSVLHRRQNVAALATSVAAAMTRQFISFVARPSGFADPGPLRFDLRGHSVERNPVNCEDECPYPASAGTGDERLDPTYRHCAAERARRERLSVSTKIRVWRLLDDLAVAIRKRLEAATGQ